MVGVGKIGENKIASQKEDSVANFFSIETIEHQQQPTKKSAKYEYLESFDCIENKIPVSANFYVNQCQSKNNSLLHSNFNPSQSELVKFLQCS